MNEKVDNIYIYIWEEFSTVYVGRTKNPRKRHYQHKTRECDKTYKFSSDHHVEHPSMIILESDLTVEEGAEREKYWINYYREQGCYNVLNKTIGGQLGMPSKYTEEERKQHQKEYYQKNKERILEYRKKYYETHLEEIKEKDKIRAKRYYEKNKKLNQQKQQTEEEKILKIKEHCETHKDKILSYKRKYYESHKNEKKVQDKKYRETHKEKIKEYYQTHKEEIKKRSLKYYYDHKKAKY